MLVPKNDFLKSATAIQFVKWNINNLCFIYVLQCTHIFGVAFMHHVNIIIYHNVINCSGNKILVIHKIFHFVMLSLSLLIPFVKLLLYCLNIAFNLKLGPLSICCFRLFLIPLNMHCSAGIQLAEITEK